MIEINLLPEELRKQEGTPLPRLLAIYAGAGLLTALAFLVAFQRFRTIPALVKEQRDLSAKVIEANRRMLAEVKPLEDEKAALTRRREISARIQKDLVAWGPRLDAIQKVLCQRVEGVWVTGFTYEEKEARLRDRTKPAGLIDRLLTIAFTASDFSDTADMHSQSNEERVAEILHLLMSQRDFSTDVLGIAPGRWDTVADYLKPPWNALAIQFPMQVVLRSPSPPEPPKPAAPVQPKKGA